MMNRKSDNDTAREREDEISIKYYIAELLEVLEYACIRPVESFPLCKTLLSMVVTAIFILAHVVVLLSEILALMILNLNFELFTNIIEPIILHTIGLMKWCHCISKRRQIIDMLTKLDRCHLLCQRIDNSEKGYRIYTNKIKYAQRYSSIFLRGWLFFNVNGMIYWCINPLLVKSWTPEQMSSINDTFENAQDKILPFITWHPPLNMNNNFNYICLYLLQTIGGVSPSLGIVCFDAFYITILIFVSAQFQYINTILTIDFDNESEAKLEKKLRNCVVCHTEILNLLQELQLFTSPPMFLQCIETIFVVCLITFETSMLKIKFDKESILILWSFFVYIFGVGLELFLFCFSATRLQHLGLQIAHSVYSCGWELERQEQPNFEKQLKHRDTAQLVQMIMLQAQRPIILTGGPFYTLSLETFKAIINGALSYSIILHTMTVADE